MQKYSFTCTCGDVMTVDAANRGEAMSKFKGMMTEDAIKAHMAAKHSGQPMPTVAQNLAMIEQTLKLVA